MAAPEGYTKLGKVGINYRGDYDSEVTYDQWDAVYYWGSTYLALCSAPPFEPRDDGINWKLLARGMVGELIESYEDLMANTVSGYIPDALAVKEGFEKNNEKIDIIGDVYKKWNIVDVTLNSDTSTEICSMVVPAGTYLITAQLGYSALMTHAGIYFSNINQMDAADAFYKPQVGSNLSTYDISLTTFCMFNKETTITLKAKGSGVITPDLRINILQAVRLK